MRHSRQAPNVFALRLLIMLAALGSAVWLRAGWDDAVPAGSKLLEGYADTDSLKARFNGRPLNHLEGLWMMGSDQALVAIELCHDPEVAPTAGEIYQLVIVRSPRLSIEPGTVLGYAAPSGRTATYDARLYTSAARSLLNNPAKFTLRAETDDTHIAIEPVKRSWKLLLRETFHFLMRVGVYADPNSARDIDGMTRIYPPSTGRPAQPVYL